MENKQSKFTNFILYSYWRASCAYRVRLALNMKNIEYKMKYINLLKSEHKDKHYEDINLFGRIPTLEFTEVTSDNKEIKHKLVESNAIIDFLEEAFPDSYNLYPKDIVKKHEVKSLVSHIACNIHPLQNLNTLKYVDSLGVDKMKFAFHFVHENLAKVDQLLSKTKGKYCFGDKVTAADCFLIPQLYFCKRFNESLDNYSNIVEVQKNLEKLEEFKKAAPENQEDAVK